MSALIALVAGPIAVHAQAQSEPSPRVALLRLISATNRADWNEMRPYFPEGSEWEAQVRRTVRFQDLSRVYSFWLRGVVIDQDSLKSTWSVLTPRTS